MLQEGYKKVYLSLILIPRTRRLRLRLFQTKPCLFKVASFRGWIVVLSGSELIEEVIRSPDNTMSVREPLEEVRTATHITLTRTHHSHLSSFNSNIPSTF